MDLKEKYFNKANDIMSRLLGEADEEEIEVGEEPEAEEPVSDDAENAGEEKGQSEQVEIFFDNLDEASQKVLMDALKESLNAADDDEFATQKIVDSLSKEPLVTFSADELVRKLNLDI